MSGRPPTHREWLASIGVGYPVYQAAHGHLVLVGQEEHVQARCTCGWTAPDRTGDAHAVGLVVDDTSWHCHQLGVRCPVHEHGCSECERIQRLTAADYARASAAGKMWWQR